MESDSEFDLDNCDNEVCAVVVEKKQQREKLATDSQHPIKPVIISNKLSKKHIIAPNRLMALGMSETRKSSLIRNYVRLYKKHHHIVTTLWFGGNAFKRKFRSRMCQQIYK